MKFVNSAITSAIFFIPFTIMSEEQTQWRYRLGTHDFVVQDSHTLGVNVSLLIDHETKNNVIFTALIDAYFDVDIDKLDPDHIPLWFKSDYSVVSELYSINSEYSFDWQFDLQGKRNTVSSVEKQIKAFPGIAANFKGQQLQAQLKMGAGYYSLEIDDDVPRTRGYDRGDFGNDSIAYTFMGRLGINLTPMLHMQVAAQTWKDNDQWLENQYRFELIYQTDFLGADNQLVLYTEHTQYNLNKYAKNDIYSSEYLPILPWNKDTLVRLSLILPW